MKKTAIYIRCAKDVSYLDLQTQLENAVKEQEDLELVGCYVDVGYSGANIDRPALRDLLSACEAGAVEAIAVKQFASLSRNAENTIRLDKLFLKNGITIYLLSGESLEPVVHDPVFETLLKIA